MSFVESILVPLHSLDRSKSTELKLRRIITNNEDNDQDTPSSCDNNNPGDGYGNDPGKQQCVTQPKLHNSFLFSSEGLDVQEETLGDTFHYDPLVNDEEIPRDSKSMFKTTLICMTQTWKKILLKSNTRSQPHIFLIFCILIMRTWRIERQTN